MRRGIALMVICAAVISAFGQHGTAPNGYYPNGFTGNTFTGVLKAVDATQQTLTLVYERGNKEPETFTGRLERACQVPSNTGAPMSAGDFDLGANVTAFYSARTRTVGGKKETENVIIAISFKSWKGNEIKDTDRRIFYCVDQQIMQFRAFR